MSLSLAPQAVLADALEPKSIKCPSIVLHIQFFKIGSGVLSNSHEGHTGVVLNQQSKHYQKTKIMVQKTFLSHHALMKSTETTLLPGIGHLAFAVIY